MNEKLFGTMAILAGGKSSRMGFNKALISINGRKLTDRIIDALIPEFDEVIISSNLDRPYLEHQVKYVPDEFVGMGPMAGIYSVLKAAHSKYVYCIACDMPYVNIEFIKFMKDKLADGNYDACCAKLGDSLEPFNAFYSTSSIAKIEAWLKEDRRSFHRFIRSLNVLVIDEPTTRKFSPDWKMFSNLNTPEDLNDYTSALNR
jgi:molybdopterin-guanine dinucleotide biosynthesis protein A